MTLQQEQQVRCILGISPECKARHGVIPQGKERLAKMKGSRKKAIVVSMCEDCHTIAVVVNKMEAKKKELSA